MGKRQIMHNIEIRKAKDEDVFSMIALLGELFDVEKDFAFDFVRHQEGLKLLMKKDDSGVFVVAVDGKVIGMITIQKIISTAMGGEVGLIEDVVVKKEYREMGIASRLFEFILAYSAKQGYSRVHLLCDRHNQTAKNFYKKLGFKESEMGAFYYFL